MSISVFKTLKVLINKGFSLCADRLWKIASFQRLQWRVGAGSPLVGSDSVATTAVYPHPFCWERTYVIMESAKLNNHDLISPDKQSFQGQHPGEQLPGSESRTVGKQSNKPIAVRRTDCCAVQ